jgi:hypothetical protein
VRAGEAGGGGFHCSVQKRIGLGGGAPKWCPILDEILNAYIIKRIL